MTTNNITGARLVTKPNTKEYDDGYDRIFKPRVYGKEEDSDKCLKNERCVIHDNEKENN